VNASFPGGVDKSSRIVQITVEERHHRQVAPMTKGSRKVRYIENRVAKVVNRNCAREA